MKTLIKNVKIFTVDDNDRVLNNGAILIKGDRIAALYDLSKALPADLEKSCDEILDGKNRMAIMPGFIDVHSHSSLLKGFSENKQLIDWLPEYQREHQVLSEADAYHGCLVTYLESLLGGTTCQLDMYRKLHKGAEAALDLGLRVHLTPYVADRADKTFFETLDDNEALIKKYHLSGNGKVHVWIGLEHLFYCSEAAYKRAASMARDYKVRIHTHSSEQKEEAQAVIDHFGKKPICLFQERGILGPHTLLAHAVWLDDEELGILKDTGTSIAHCPTSNAKLAGGIAPVPKWKQLGIGFGLGTDGGISNNSMSMIELMKFASLAQKAQTQDAAILSATECLRLATIEGAKVLGVDKDIGSLEVGKKADIVAIDLWQPHLLPLAPASDHDPILWNLVFAGRASDVVHVWVDGEQVVKNKMPTRMDLETIMEAIHKQTVDLLKRRESTNAKAMVV